MANERQMKMSLIENAEKIAKILASGKDVEIRKSPSGVTVAEVTKKVVVK